MPISRSVTCLSRIALVAVGLAATSPASASSDETEKKTVVQVTPYVWASGFGGTFRPSPAIPSIEVKKSFGELLEDVDAALFVSGLVRHDKLVIVGDFTHTSSSKEGLVPTGNPAIPIVPAEGRLKQTSATLLAGARVVEQDNASLDLLAGGRAWWIKAGVDVPPLAASAEAKRSFVDPVVAARLNIKASPSLSVLLYGDIGGFTVASDITAQAVVTANFRVANKIWLSGGYRYLTVDFKRQNFRVDAALGGPIVGATITF